MYPYTTCKHNLVELPSLTQWQDLYMFHMEDKNLFHRNITGLNTAITKNTCKCNAETPTLMQPALVYYELLLLCVSHACPYDR